MPTAQKRAKAPTDTLAEARNLRDRIAELHLETVGMVLPAKAEQTARQWFSRLSRDIEDDDAALALAEAVMLAVDLETFTPSHTGATALDRLARRRKLNRDEEAALRVLKQARFTPMVLRSASGGDRYSVQNLVTKQNFTLFDDQLPPDAVGMPLVARLCVLGDGIMGTVGVVTPLDDDGLAVALDFVRPGRGIVHDHRCAAAVYRHVVRNGGPKIRGVNAFDDPGGSDDEDVSDGQLSALDVLATRLLNEGRMQEPTPDILDEARRLVSIDTILEALFKAVESRRAGASDVGTVYRRFAEVQIEALHLRSVAGSGLDRAPLDTLSQAIDREVATQNYPRGAAELFRDIRRVVVAVKAKQDQEDLTRVIERIRGLRAKTIDQGCTEEEAMAAANKVAEMLDRYGLSLGEIDLRAQACHGYGIDSTRKRSGALDECLPAVARFCDCRAWQERSGTGTIRSVLFGLPADVEAARYLYERVATAFETETATFQAGSLYVGWAGADRRDATKSFQVGLARGICERLIARKAERDETSLKASGRDLVPVKASVVEDELAKLGLAFTSKPAHRSRLVMTDAFQAGKVAGLQFEAQGKME